MTKILSENNAILGDLEHKHATYDLVCGALRKKTLLKKFKRKSHHKFTAVVRHPLRWYESWFKYQTANNFREWGTSDNPQNWHVMSSLNGIRSDNFNSFIRDINRRSPGFVSNMYAKYIDNSNTFVLKNETLRQDFEELNNAFDLGVETGQIKSQPNFGVSPTLQISWDRDIFEETIALEKSALVRFGYESECPVTVS